MLETVFTIFYLIVHYAFLALIVLMIARWILSLFRLSDSNPIMLFLTRCTEPVILPFRRRIPPVSILDMSWIFAFVSLLIVQTLLEQAIPLTLR
jgi:uncharacterized protein YggT (Ycf19 family)